MSETTKQRGTEKRQRERLVHVRCTDDEFAAINAAAATAGMTVGAFMRHQCIGTAGPRAVRRPQVDRVELARMFGLIGRYGSNLYQLVRAANMRGDSVSEAQLEQVAGEVHEMRSALRQALGFDP